MFALWSIPFFCCFGLARTWGLSLRTSQSCWIATSKSISSFSLLDPIFPNFTRFEIPTISRIFFHGSLGNSFGIVPRRPAQSLVKFGEDLDKIWVEKLKTRGCFCPHRIVRREPLDSPVQARPASSPPDSPVPPNNPAPGTGQSGEPGCSPSLVGFSFSRAFLRLRFSLRHCCPYSLPVVFQQGSFR